jgi:hypothetical protein
MASATAKIARLTAIVRYRIARSYAASAASRCAFSTASSMVPTM